MGWLLVGRWMNSCAARANRDRVPRPCSDALSEVEGRRGTSVPPNGTYQGSAAREDRHTARRRIERRAADVRLLLPGDDVAQHPQAGHAVEVHRPARLRELPLRLARRRTVDRGADAPVRERASTPST